MSNYNNKMNELRPCFFCGEKPTVLTDCKTYKICCLNPSCLLVHGITTGDCGSFEDAERSWNLELDKE